MAGGGGRLQPGSSTALVFQVGPPAAQLAEHSPPGLGRITVGRVRDGKLELTGNQLDRAAETSPLVQQILQASLYARDALEAAGSGPFVWDDYTPGIRSSTQSRFGATCGQEVLLFVPVLRKERTSAPLGLGGKRRTGPGILHGNGSAANFFTKLFHLPAQALEIIRHFPFGRKVAQVFLHTLPPLGSDAPFMPSNKGRGAFLA